MLLELNIYAKYCQNNLAFYDTKSSFTKTIDEAKVFILKKRKILQLLLTQHFFVVPLHRITSHSIYALKNL